MELQGHPGAVRTQLEKTICRLNREISHLSAGSKSLGYSGCGCETMCYCNRRVIKGMITVVDSMLLNLTQALQTREMWSNTLIVFLGDNGAPNNNAGANTVFKGMKFSREYFSPAVFVFHLRCNRGRTSKKPWLLHCRSIAALLTLR
jgi:hypothetical protein